MDSDSARRLLGEERSRLLEIRRAIEHDELDRQTEEESFAELAHADQHPADVASEVFEREKEFGILAAVDAELDAVRDALAAVDRGTYGVCESCGESIPDDRLRSLPATRFCTAHQAAIEQGSPLTMAGGAYAAGGDARSAEEDAASEAADNLDLVPDDEEEELEEPGAEEAALHITRFP